MIVIAAPTDSDLLQLGGGALAESVAQRGGVTHPLSASSGKWSAECSNRSPGLRSQKSHSCQNSHTLTAETSPSSPSSPAAAAAASGRLHVLGPEKTICDFFGPSS